MSRMGGHRLMPHRKLAAAIAAAGGGETDFDVDHTHGPVKPISPTAAVEPSFAGATIDSYLPYLRGKPLLHNFSRNLAAGITVSLVNVPLSIALSIASACPPMYGIVTAIWAGFLAAICGGSHFNIVGPTGALSSVLSTYAIRYGAEALPTLAVVTGILCMIYFVFHWDVYVRFLPGYVVHGFTLGVAVTIAGGQIASACGLRGLTVYPDFRDSLLEALSHIGEAQSHAILLFLSSWIPLFLLVRWMPRIPWSIPLCILGIAVGYCSDNGYFGPDANFLTLRDKYGANALTPHLTNFVPLFSSVPASPEVSVPPMSEMLKAALSVSFVAVLETLISGRIADTLTRSNMNQRREVFGAAMANLASGICGGLPATAALARTALNIRSGGHTRLAPLINAIGTTFLVLVILPLFTYLPLPVVAALLFQVAVGMVELKHIRQYWESDHISFAMTFVVAGFCVALDSTVGIVVGAIFGLLRFAKKVSHSHADVILSNELDADAGDGVSGGSETHPLVLSSEALQKALAAQHPGKDASTWEKVNDIFADADSYTGWSLGSLTELATAMDPYTYRTTHNGQNGRNGQNHSGSNSEQRPSLAIPVSVTTGSGGASGSGGAGGASGSLRKSSSGDGFRTRANTMIGSEVSPRQAAFGSVDSPSAAAGTGHGRLLMSGIAEDGMFAGGAHARAVASPTAAVTAGSGGSSAISILPLPAVSESGVAANRVVPVYRIYGMITYVNLQEHHDLLARLYPVADRYIIVSLQHTYVFDVDGIDALEEIEEMLTHAGKTLLLADVHRSRVLSHSRWFQHMVSVHHVFTTTDDALEFVRKSQVAEAVAKAGTLAGLTNTAKASSAAARGSITGTGGSGGSGGAARGRVPRPSLIASVGSGSGPMLGGSGGAGGAGAADDVEDEAAATATATTRLLPAAGSANPSYGAH